MEKIIYGFYQSSVGEIVLAKTDKGVCWLGFMVKGYKGDGLERMFRHLKGFDLRHDDSAVQSLGDELMQLWEEGREAELVLDLRGTAFQKDVWRALLSVKRGQTCSYGDIANDLGKPKALRAVGSAVGSNPVSLILPCHRVVQKTGALGNYGWGLALKQRLLEEEGGVWF